MGWFEMRVTPFATTAPVRILRCYRWAGDVLHQLRRTIVEQVSVESTASRAQECFVGPGGLIMWSMALLVVMVRYSGAVGW